MGGKKKMNLGAKLRSIEKQMETYPIKNKQNELIKEQIASCSTEELKEIAENETTPEYFKERLRSVGVDIE